MTKNLLVLLLKIALVFAIVISAIKPALVKAENNSVTVYLFWAEGCPHCEKEIEFLDAIKTKYPQVEIKKYEVIQNPDNRNLLKSVGEKLDTNVSGVPFTVIGEKYFAGFYSNETTGEEIENEIKNAIKQGYFDIVSQINKADVTPIPESKTITLPVFGNISVEKFSLPVITLLVAALDGFNPCAMWVLIFLIGLLLGTNNRKKMWILGFAFIMSSAFVYFLFLSAWLNLFFFLSFVSWIKLGVGLLAFGAGIYYLYDFYKNKSGACKVVGGGKKQAVYEKMKFLINQPNFVLSIVGIILLAFGINLIELVCSAGLPAIYTNLLSLSDLTLWQYYLYLIFYVFIFMLDDLIVFCIAMITLKITGLEGKFSRYSHLIGGVLMLIIGFLMLFKPEWLMGL